MSEYEINASVVVQDRNDERIQTDATGSDSLIDYAISCVLEYQNAKSNFRMETARRHLCRKII